MTNDLQTHPLMRHPTAAACPVAAVEASRRSGNLATRSPASPSQRLRTLVDYLQDKLGVFAATFAPAAVAMAPRAGVVIEDVPSSVRIAVIKVVRTLCSRS
ncbi:hypothetical protein BT93_J1569 [Corymbia citriodora subsp. variegata]|nr:hypothetical protein BT93_J1569 [Corymbia citriodora subsp. variegata]